MLKAENISRIFKRKHGTVNALDNVSVDIREGDFVSIVGPSGSGKSTLLLALGGMSHPNEGTVSWFNQSIYNWDVTRRSQWRGSSVGFVFQSFNLVPYLTVFENVSVGLSLANNGAADIKLVDSILSEVELDDRKDHLPSELSIGQQQRVALARALVKKPQLILADEPTGNLDPDTGNEVMDIIKRQHAAGTTVIMITHDPHIAEMAQRKIRIVDGQII
ncbi:MAG: ABC transporter ATP-binding protein [Chitinispirillaceae bacterium]|jgi:putative ABC transport system ATP-binding protein|nr:ABC transporter ATP-binding protein [Chitinispirillaceae bacterium]